MKMNLVNFLRMKMKWVSKRVNQAMALLITLTASPAFAVDRSVAGMNSVNTWLGTIIPIAAGMGITAMALAYMLGWMGKELCQRIGVGCIIGGAGSWFVSLFF